MNYKVIDKESYYRKGVYLEQEIRSFVEQPSQN